MSAVLRHQSITGILSKQYEKIQKLKFWKELIMDGSKSSIIMKRPDMFTVIIYHGNLELY